MKVWICIIGWDYDGYQIEKTFSSLEKALAWQEETDSLMKLGEVPGDYTNIRCEEVL